MAGNLKGLSGIKGLVLRHGEKVVIAVIGCLAAWLAVKSFSLEHLEDKYQAGKLHEAITATTSAVQEARWPEKGSELDQEVHHAEPIGAKADTAVNPQAYQPPVPYGLDAPIVAATTPREDPKLLNPVEVRATGGSGLFAFLDEEIRKKQALRAAAEAEQRAKKQADEAAKAAQNNAPGGFGEGGGRNRGPGAGPEGMMGAVEYDPKHPKRRAIEGMARPVGIQLQGGERIEEIYWAAVAAKVPIREQLKLYQDAFEKAKMGFDPMRDFPQYIGFLVQRVEVVPGKEIQEADWKPVPVYEGQRKSILANKPLHPSAMATSVMEKLYAAAASFWAGMSQSDVIDARYIDYVLTSPLPPLVGRDWGSEASHPGFPSIADTPPLEEMMPTTPTPTTPEKPAATDLNTTFSATAPGAMPAGPGMMPGGGMGPGGRMGEYGGGRGPGPGGGGYGGGYGGYGGMGMGGGRYGGEEGGYSGRRGPGGYGGGYGPGGYGGEGGRSSYGGSMPSAGTQRTSLPKGVDFLLLRFFDYTVEPGKKYRYRVQMVLSDPNGLMPENVLAPTVLDRLRKESQAAKAQNAQQGRPNFRRAEGWSDPSPVVGIPLAGGARLAEAKAASEEKIGDEPVAKLLIDAFDKDSEGNAIQTALERDLRRGDVANFTSDAEYVVAIPPSIDTHPGFKFSTGITLVDVDGGEKLSGKDMSSPGRVMLMGPAGDLFIRNELDDKQAVEFHKMLFYKSKNPGGAFGPEGPGPGAGNRGPGLGPGGRGRGN